MANLEFWDKHNLVAYLKKPTRSEGFQEIVDFLNGSHIRFALIKNPTIYVSLIKKFCQTATVRTVDNGEQEITATVDGKEFTITKAYVRRHLQLADVKGISALPTTEIFDQLSLMGEHTRLFPSMLAIQAEEGEGSGHPSEPQQPHDNAQPTYEEPIPNLPQTSVPIPNVADEGVFKEWDDRVVRATTTTASFDAAHASGNITKTQSTTIPNVPLPLGIGAGGSPRCQETMGVPLLRLGLRGIDGFMYYIVQESGELRGRLEANKEVSTDSGEVSTTSRLFSTAEESVSTAGASMPVSTAGMVQEVNISIPSLVVVKDKGKGIMTDSEDEQTKRTKLHQEQDKLGHEAAVRLQEELDEEERQRMARVHAAA
ncbi:hypothetical protein Tco_0451594 [Tanacetum coccineum]